ncbi:MAG: phytanoyl-CoA dioxygenase family protein [Rhodospirillales bacterium]|nr:phytanoyl-CoA dioxygenase family protein [Rhodospirillales bacterium]
MINERHVADFHRLGFAVVRGVFSNAEIAELAERFDCIWAEGLTHPKSFRHGNVFWRIADDANLGRIVRYMQWPAYFDRVLDRIRRDPRMLDIVRPLIGDNLKQIINQLHWKPPGAAMAEFGFHQDIRFRRPRDAYRNPAEAYVQTGIAIDPHDPGSGAMIIYPGSHRLGEVTLGGLQVLSTMLDLDDLARLGLDASAAVSLDLQPGDVALWHLFTIHGSGANTSSRDRRFYLNGYVRAGDCDRGEWTFRAGRPVPLGAPTLVHYEDLPNRPDPHYVD